MSGLQRSGAGREERRLTEKSRHYGMTASRLVILMLTVLAGPTRAQPESHPAATAPLTVGEVEIRTHDIFSPDEVSNTNGALRFMRRTMNSVHFNTRHHVIRRELLFHPGDVFIPAQLAETERNLRDLGYLNNVHVSAVDTTDDGRVKVVVSTREAWTLRTSLSYSLASSGDQRWSVSGSDGNFLGHGVTAGAGVGADEDSSYWNLWYRQRRLFKAGFWLGLDYSQREDGYTRRVILNRPFYALDDPWGLELRGWNRAFDQRFYLSNGGPAGVDPSNPDRLYALLAYQEKGLEARFQVRTSSVLEGRVWRLGGGLDIVDKFFREDLREVALSDGRSADLRWLNEFGQPYAREQGVEVNPFLWLYTEGRRWAKSRFVRQYGPVEDIPLDWVLDVKVGPVGGNVGSTTGYGLSRWHAEATFQRWFPVRNSYVLTQLVALGDAGSEPVRTYQYGGVVGWVGKAGAEQSPWLTRIFAEYSQAENLSGANALLLGLDRGLRTLDFDGMAGDHLVRWSVEQGKATPWEAAGLVRFGVAAFYSGGSAWWRDEERGADGYRHEVGFGIRFGPTRAANSQIARIDLAWNLNRSDGPVITAITRGLF
jgi:hypothetical protein